MGRVIIQEFDENGRIVRVLHAKDFTQAFGKRNKLLAANKKHRVKIDYDRGFR